ncbi:MAG: cytochrome P450, partial [Terrimesophilobacter sp.]
VCRQVAQELVAALPRGEQVEFISAFALEYALEAQRAWLGWPAYTVDALRHWTARNHRATLHRDREALDAVATDFDTTVHRVLRDQRAQLRTSSTERLPAPVETPASFPAATPISSTDTAATVTALLLDETIDGVPLSDNELVSILRNWTVGELGTISASVGILVAYLAGHPNLQAELRGAPEKIPAAIEEILRMHSPLIANRRVATRDTELGGRRISAGERVNVNWASANRDEARFGNPDDYQPELNAADNLLYGRGIHDCPGAPLARLELRIVVEELLAATNSIDTALAGAPDFASYPASGYRTLPMTFS